MAPALDVIVDCNRCASDRLRAAKIESDLLSSMKSRRTHPSKPTPWQKEKSALNLLPDTPPSDDFTWAYLNTKALTKAGVSPVGSGKPRMLSAVNLPGHSIGIAARAVFPIPVHQKAYPPREQSAGISQEAVPKVPPMPNETLPPEPLQESGRKVVVMEVVLPGANVGNRRGGVVVKDDSLKLPVTLQKKLPAPNRYTEGPVAGPAARQAVVLGRVRHFYNFFSTRSLSRSLSLSFYLSLCPISLYLN